MVEFSLRRACSPDHPRLPDEDAVSVSASQFKTYQRCPRLWWMQKVAGVKEREKQHLVIGHALHGRAEIYHIGSPGQDLYPAGWDKGLTTLEAQWVRESTDRAISLGLWQRIPGRLVEEPVCLLVGEHVLDHREMPLVARADTYTDKIGVRKVHQPCSLRDGRPLPIDWDRYPVLKGFIDIFDHDPKSPLVGDHKSAKSRRYALTPEKLAKDTQVLCYSAWALGIIPTADEVRLRHNVFLKDPAATTPAYPVDARTTLDDVKRHWKEVISWVVDMSRLRREYPCGQGDSRANDWHHIPGAVQLGRSDECEAYGGCPMRDLCFGRCLAQQLVARYDSPDPVKLVQQAEVSFGLRPSPPKEKPTMAFNRPTPTFTEGQDAYVLDPENSAVQYRVRIDRLNVEPGQSSIVLWPNADVEPDFNSCGMHYRLAVPNSSLMIIPLATAKVTGYYEALIAAGEKAESIAWSPKASPTPPAAHVDTAKVPERSENDGKFGLRPSSPATPSATDPTAPVTAPTVPAAAPTTSPAVDTTGLVYSGAGAVIGTVLEVAPTNHTFWAKLVGKLAIVKEITAGDAPGTLMFSVEIEGFPYEHVLPARFKVPQASFAAVAAGNMGKIVHVEMVDGTTINVPVEALYNDGFMTLSGTKKVLFTDVKSIVPFNEKEHVPQREPTKEEKAEAKAAAKAEKVAAKEAAKDEKAAAKASPAGESMTATTPVTAEQCVDQAISLCETALNGGKVTRKVIEGVLPLLKMLKEKGTGISDGQVIAPVGGDPVLRGVVRVALQHAVGVITDAMNRIPE